MTFFQFLLAVSVMLGSGLGVIFGFVLGPSKMMSQPCSNFHETISYGFYSVYGPLLGLKGVLLQKFLGFGETFAGICVFVGVWLDVVGIIGAVPAIPKHLMQGMVIVSAIGLIAEMGVATALQHRLSEFADEDSSDDEEPDEVEVKVAGKNIKKLYIPAFYLVSLTLFVFIRIWAFYPKGPFTQTLTNLMSFSLLLLAGFMVLHVHDHGRHRREIFQGLKRLNNEQQNLGGVLL